MIGTGELWSGRWAVGHGQRTLDFVQSLNYATGETEAQQAGLGQVQGEGSLSELLFFID
jgi:hypothetical protein